MSTKATPYICSSPLPFATPIPDFDDDNATDNQLTLLLIMMLMMLLVMPLLTPPTSILPLNKENEVSMLLPSISQSPSLLLDSSFIYSLIPLSFSSSSSLVI